MGFIFSFVAGFFSSENTFIFGTVSDNECVSRNKKLQPKSKKNEMIFSQT